MPRNSGIRINLIVISTLDEMLVNLPIPTCLESLISKKVDSGISLFLYMAKTIGLIPSSRKDIKQNLST